jgi:hypothetical protein
MTGSVDRLKGLVISEPWISLILNGHKTREMRPRVFSYRGPLAVIRKASGAVEGIVDLVDCIPHQHEAEYRASEGLHCIPKAEHKDCAAKWPVAWVFANARLLSEPVPYKHKRGAQSQVVLSDQESAAVFSRDPKIVQITSLGRREIRLSRSNIANHSLPLRTVVDFFPDDAIGGSNADDLANRLLTIIYEGRATNSDIDRSKWILRDRRASREFFSLTAAKVDDVVVVDRLAEYVYTLRLKRDAST